MNLLRWLKKKNQQLKYIKHHIESTKANIVFIKVMILKISIVSSLESKYPILTLLDNELNNSRRKKDAQKKENWSCIIMLENNIMSV